MLEVPFDWRSQYSGQDDSIRGCSLSKEAHVLQHDQNSPPFCLSQQSAEEREKQTTFVIIKLLPFMLWSITLLPPTERRPVSIQSTKECIQLCSLFLFKVYIALNYCEWNNQHAHVIPGPDSIKINLALVLFFVSAHSGMYDSIKCDFFCVRWDNSFLCKNVLYSKVIVVTMCVVKVYFYLLYKSASTFMSNDLTDMFLITLAAWQWFMN